MVSAVHGRGACPGFQVSHWGLLQGGRTVLHLQPSRMPDWTQGLGASGKRQDSGLGLTGYCRRLENGMKQLVMREIILRTLSSKLTMQLVPLLFHLTMLLLEALSCRYLHCLCFTVLSRRLDQTRRGGGVWVLCTFLGCTKYFQIAEWKQSTCKCLLTNNEVISLLTACCLQGQY